MMCRRCADVICHPPVTTALHKAYRFPCYVFYNSFKSHIRLRFTGRKFQKSMSGCYVFGIGLVKMYEKQVNVC